MFDYKCDKFKSGYEGQKYQVVADDGDGNQIAIGWTNNESGHPLVSMVEKHPVWRNPKVLKVTNTSTGDI